MAVEHESTEVPPDTDFPDAAEIPGRAAGVQSPELWSWLPRVSARQVRLEAWLARWTGDGVSAQCFDWIRAWFREKPRIGPPEVVWRASGLGRPGLIAQFRWPTLHARLALGLEVPLAHVVVDRLLGYDRPFAKSRLQLTPVEWGVWTYLIIRSLEEWERAVPDDQRAAQTADPEAPPLLVLDSVGPGSFDPAGLGAMVTIRWSVSVGDTTGTARLWLPETVLKTLVAQKPPAATNMSTRSITKVREYSSLWRAVGGLVAMPNGLKRLRAGGVVPLVDSRLTGTPQSPAGLIELVCGPTYDSETFQFPAEPLEGSSGRVLRLIGPLTRYRIAREPLTLDTNPIMSTSSSQSAADRSGTPTSEPAGSPLDVPITLTVELGRVNLTLSRLADLKPGDTVELGRHSREPVELTSNGRLIARGELVLIDTELGVRVTHVFL